MDDRGSDGRPIVWRSTAVHERNLPGGASDADLRRLAASALEFAKHVPNLTRALEIGVRESLAGGLMFVPRPPARPRPGA